MTMKKVLFKHSQIVSLLVLFAMLVFVAGCTQLKKEAPAEEVAAVPAEQASETAPIIEEALVVKAIVGEEVPTSEPVPAPVTAVSATKPEVKTLAPDDPASLIYLGSDGTVKGRGDPLKAVGSLTRYTEGDHAKALTLPSMPKDKFGLIDWIKMADEKIINPASSLDVNKVDVPPFDMNVEIQAKGDFVKDVIFRHKTHTYWLSCENCHTGIFQMAKGANHMSMVGIVEGKWCGRCHGKVSFPLADCTRCHVKDKQ